MPRAVLDSTILVSAFLTPQGLTAQLLSQARRGAFDLYLSEDILQETQQVLLEREHIRKRHPYSDEQAIEFCQALRPAVHLVTHLPTLPSLTRDPNDDMVVACAVAAQATYLVTRDKDLLTLGKYQGVSMVPPEEFMGILREKGKKGP